MKLAIALAGLLATSAWGQVTCTNIGNFTTCSDGTTYNRIGNFTFGSDGSTANRVGNHTFITPPPQQYQPQIAPIAPIAPIAVPRPPRCGYNTYGQYVCY